jgi:hypothetical protein
VHGSGEFRRAILATLVRRAIEDWPAGRDTKEAA